LANKMTVETRLFTHDWRMTIGDLVVSPVTPAKVSAHIWGVANTHTADSFEDKKRKFLAARIEAAVQRNGLATVIYAADDADRANILGFGGVERITPPGTVPSVANLGLELFPAARGRGVGTAFVRALLCLSVHVDVDQVEIGTMQDNAAMRGVARKLGLSETLEIKYLPAGTDEIVADVMYFDIQRQFFSNINFDLTFGEQINWVQ
ncbi:hypothetical protein HK100_001782, partial [Physocladia obscura]